MNMRNLTISNAYLNTSIKFLIDNFCKITIILYAYNEEIVVTLDCCLPFYQYNVCEWVDFNYFPGFVLEQCF